MGWSAAAILVLAFIDSWAAPKVPGVITSSAQPPRRVDQIRQRHLPDLRLTDHTGRELHFYRDMVRGKVVAINFMYASCSRLCELASQNMARLQDELGDRLGHDAVLYSISLDPEHDTPAALAAYREQHGARPGWLFLTAASLAEVTDLRRKLGVFDPDPERDSDLSSHTNMVILGNERIGRWTMMPALAHPVRLRQALDRVILPPEQWPRGEAVVQAVPRQDSLASLRNK